MKKTTNKNRRETIIAQKSGRSEWLAICSNGETLFEGRTFSSRNAVYADVRAAYLSSSWKLRKARKGYSILVD